MLSKNNHYGKRIANTPHTPRYALRRLKVGLVSVTLGTVFFFTPQALADTTSEVDTGTNSTTVAANNTTENHTTNNKVSLTNATSAPVDTSKDTVQTTPTLSDAETVTNSTVPTTSTSESNNLSSTDTTQNSSTNNTTIQTNNLNSKVQAKLQANPSNTNITISDGDTNQVVPLQQTTTSKELPQTGEEYNGLTTIGLLMLSLATGFGLKKRKKD